MLKFQHAYRFRPQTMHIQRLLISRLLSRPHARMDLMLCDRKRCAAALTVPHARVCAVGGIPRSHRFSRARARLTLTGLVAGHDHTGHHITEYEQVKRAAWTVVHPGAQQQPRPGGPDTPLVRLLSLICSPDTAIQVNMAHLHMTAIPKKVQFNLTHADKGHLSVARLPATSPPRTWPTLVSGRVLAPKSTPPHTGVSSFRSVSNCVYRRCRLRRRPPPCRQTATAAPVKARDLSPAHRAGGAIDEDAATRTASL